MNNMYVSAIAAAGMVFCSQAHEKTELTAGSEGPTHSAALFDGKNASGSHDAIHREDMVPTNRPIVALATQWQSKYVTAGRDNLTRGGIYSLECVIEWQGISGGIWYAVGDDESYKELNAFIEYGVAVGPLDLSLGYARLEFLEDHTDDNELAAGAALNNVPYIVPSVDYVYSTEADGGLLEVTFKTGITFMEERLSLEPYVLQAFDFGYSTAAHDGLNNVQIGIGASLALMHGLDLVGSISHSWAQADVEREGLGDVSWCAVGLAATF
ncbi:MAG: hypothetical protein K9M54_01210 [Kiritimatiellales bacterium]|nr:hypothetical protein [Kiritimatiellales bacterium]MCF7863220.1 hypothetical protein [Kiritimatiellales bacterium]